MKPLHRRHGAALATGIAALAIALPVLAASPSPVASPSPSPDPSATPSPTDVPTKTAEPTKTAKPERTAKPEKSPEVSTSLEGKIQEGTDVAGRPVYTMTVDGATWILSAGPPWFWGDKNPLAAFVGKSVTVAGTIRAGDDEVDIETVDGKALRAPGKPPWAGGPWVVGPTHPGWKDWMAAGKPGNGLGRENAPGQLKKAPPAP